MRINGIIKVWLVFLLDFYGIYQFAGIEAAIIVTIGIAAYVWLGEYIEIFRNRGLRVDKASGYERIKLMHSKKQLAEKIFKKEGSNISNIKFYILPSDDANAFSYGVHCIGITRGALRNLDEITISGLLAHEISHRNNLDPVFRRVIFLNVCVLLITLAVSAFFSSLMIWMVFFVLCFFGVCGGFASYFLVTGISKASKGLFSGLQRIIVFIFQANMGLISRHSEYRADKYAADMGYGYQLKYFLNRFVIGVEQQRARSLLDALYDTHPLPEKRIARLEKQISQISIM